MRPVNALFGLDREQCVLRISIRAEPFGRSRSRPPALAKPEIPSGLLDPDFQLHPLGDATLARSFERADMQVGWSNRFATGRASITARSVGSGWIEYVGTYLTEALVPILFEPAFSRAGVEP
jgi:hypothetical protein